MANAYTDILSGASLGVNLVQTAYDQKVEFALRSMPLYRQIADKRPEQQAMPGSSVVFQFYNDFTENIGTAPTPLVETTDPDAVAIPSTSTASVTLNEYGKAQLSTVKLRALSLSDIDPAVANIVARDMAVQMDNAALSFLRQGTNVVKEAAGVMSTSAATNTITATDTAKSRDVRFVVARLRSASVVPRIGEYYMAFVHPDVSHDLRSEANTNGVNWREPHAYSAARNIWAGEIGEYEGAVFIETPRVYTATDGATSTKVYRSLFVGQQALAEAVAIEPHVVVGPVTDKLMRFRSLGWYGLLGWNRYREQALWRLETASSIGAL